MGGDKMNEQNAWVTFIQSGGGKLIGMSLAYIASFMGLAFAWYNWRKREQMKKAREEGK
jgi:hypothetical protein